MFLVFMDEATVNEIVSALVGMGEAGASGSVVGPHGDERSYVSTGKRGGNGEAN